MRTHLTHPLMAALLGVAFTAELHAQGTTFTYQGRLDDNGAAYTGSAEFQATLWDAASGGSQIAVNAPAQAVVGVTNGLFVLPLDFDANFPGADRWLQLEVRTTIGPFTVLSPRQPLTPTPYAITAGNVTGPVPAGQLSGAVPDASLAGTYSQPVTFNNGGNSFSGEGAGLTGLNASELADGIVPDDRLPVDLARTDQVWLLGGNTGTTPETQFIGTTDNQPLELRVNHVRALRLEEGSDGNGAPNVIGGAPVNFVTPGMVGATISGGGATNLVGGARTNSVTASFGTVGGGSDNTASGLSSTVAGGNLNTASGFYSTVGGGASNTASAFVSTVGGGQNNTASGPNSTVGGGFRHTASGSSSTVAGGFESTASGSSSTVAGGSRNTASGDWSTVGGGTDNTAAGANSFAAGRQAKANHQGAFVWADSQNSDFASQRANQFRVRADGGVRMDINDNQWFEFRSTFPIFSPERILNTSSGAYLSTGGSWVNSSDRDRKEDFKPVNPLEVLDALVLLPIATWNYKSQDGRARHLGPVAQDFHAAFGLGGDDKAIATVDADGVALAAIQGLNQKVEVRSRRAEDRIQKLETDLKRRDAENATLAAQNRELESRLSALEKLIHRAGGELLSQQP